MVTVAVLSFGLSPALAKKSPKTKIGFVDLNMIMSKLDDGRSAKKKFQRAMKRRKSRFLKKQKEVEALKIKLEKTLKTKKPTELKTQFTKYQKKVQGLQKYYQSSQKRLHTLRKKTFGPIFNRLTALVQLVSERNGVTLMLERQKSGLLSASEKIDYSGQVIKAYEGLKGK